VRFPSFPFVELVRVQVEACFLVSGALLYAIRKLPCPSVK
jgi:hypothetical protein